MVTEVRNITPYQKNIHIAGGLVCQITTIVGVYCCFLPEISASAKLFMVVFSLCCQYFTVYLIKFAFTAKLTISETGLCFRAPFTTTMCKWKDFNQTVMNGYGFDLISTDKAVITHTILSKSYTGKKGIIPIHRFVTKWKKEEDWKKDPLLLLISERLAIKEESIQQKYFL